MIKRLKTKTRSTTIELLQRTGQLDRVLKARQWWNRRWRVARERAVRRSLVFEIQGLESDRSELVGAISSDSGRVRGVVGRRWDGHRVVDAMISNRELVMAAIESAGIRHQQLPVDSPNRYRIAIPVGSRPELLRALAEFDVTIHLYLDDPATAPSKRIVHITAGTLRHIERFAARAEVWRVFEYLTLPDGSDTFGDLYGCEVEFWTNIGGNLVQSARWNELVTITGSHEFGRSEAAHELISKPTFPVDLVYTWVDGDDPAWQQRRRDVSGSEVTERHAEAANDARFASRDELLYSLRSVERFADFVRHVYVVTDRQCPTWLDLRAEGISLVDHSEIFAEPEALPTFNSHAIESRLHHIPGLSEHYIYLNDDFFFGRRVLPDLFFLANGIAKHFPSRSLIPLGEPSLDEKPVDAAAMNVRRLVEREFRVTPTRKFKHAPYPQLRSVNLEIESLFPIEMAETSGSRFRHPSDVALASSLHHHVGFVRGHSVPGRIATRYIDLGEPDVEARLDRLLATRNFDTLCLNDSDTGAVDDERKARLLAGFLDAYFPVKSRFEL